MEKPSERLNRKIIIDHLWLPVLTMLLKRKMIGYEIRGEIKKHYGFWCGNVTAYKVLYLLEKDGYVKSERISGKVYYTITARGRGELNQGKKILRKLAV
ncbi:MAG: helix-turn-helix transcriptional regulator [Candidatus Aenigmarchaeota archaeon]|nr:helix-turn-helix transcriptional regulator [Candidatus Aenigmarchaeota archaeon]